MLHYFIIPGNYNCSSFLETIYNMCHSTCFQENLNLNGGRKLIYMTYRLLKERMLMEDNGNYWKSQTFRLHKACTSGKRAI